MGGSGGAAGMGGDGGGGSTNCDPAATPLTDGCSIDDEHGLFAASSAPGGGDGSKAKPFADLQQAVDAAASAGKMLFVCGQDTYDVSAGLVVPSGVEMFGGFVDCQGGGEAPAWTYDAGEHAKLSAKGATIAVKLAAGDGRTLLDGFDVVTDDASDPGDSRIGILADATEAKLDHLTVFAGKGATGAAGHAWETTAASGSGGDTGGSNGLCAGTSSGGEGGGTACNGVGGKGGSGGGGTTLSLKPAGAGLDGQPAMALTGQGGAAEANANTLGFCDTLGKATPGGNGEPGESGGGGTGKGTIFPSGYAGADGTDGKPGASAQGGGGGGGRAGFQTPDCMLGQLKAGSGGGGGGGGGCGGQGGGGGKAGGSSFAIVAITANLALGPDVELQANDGGDGGAGAFGQIGGSGGFAGDGGFPEGCPGAEGGDGGLGGHGGGGQGGHSACIAALNAMVTPPATCSKGQPGLGGASPGAGGDSGLAQLVITF